MNTKQLLCALTVCSTLASTAALAGNAPLQQVQKKWAECQYGTPDGDEKEQCFHRAIAKTSIYLDREPGNPELTVWLAINKASLAGAQGGLGALSLAKEAKSLLEGVIATSPQALDGSAYTSLGSLYYKVPGWPIGFGDDDKAEEMLKKALEINPKGIDPNYFYGDFLAEEGRDKEAKVYLTRAMQASPRPDRPLADKGRKLEIEATLGRLK
ncbi:TPA: tetratricopeptide repeat protein [Vibrio diabolicus]